jgi:replication factor A1
VGAGSSIRIPKEEPLPIIFEGTIIAGQGCTFIDNGKQRYLIDKDLPHGAEIQVTGVLSGNRIIVKNTQTVDIKAESLLVQIHGFIEEL